MISLRAHVKLVTMDVSVILVNKVSSYRASSQQLSFYYNVTFTAAVNVILYQHIFELCAYFSCPLRMSGIKYSQLLQSGTDYVWFIVFENHNKHTIDEVKRNSD